MPRELERESVRLVAAALGAELAATPQWLVRPGRRECGFRWSLVSDLYRHLTGMVLPESMPPRERRIVDAVLLVPGQAPRIFEFDETQHFNRFRSETLAMYAGRVALAFSADAWIAQGKEKQRLEGGGFGKPKPPLFPGDGGRHRQRAFRDALCDLLPEIHGFAPTLRMADFEVRDWLFNSDAHQRMSVLLASRLLSVDSSWTQGRISEEPAQSPAQPSRQRPVSGRRSGARVGGTSSPS